MIQNKTFIFLTGMHRSGTSMLHEILKNHPLISGFENTSASEDEGQHLQTVFKNGKYFGGLGRFAFNPRAYMDESHELAKDDKAELLFREWGQYWDLTKPFLIEKSPPTIIRTRFFQKLYPNSKFVIVLRHPLSVSLATKKLRKFYSLNSILEHTLKCYETFLEDKEHLKNVFILRYEDFVESPQKVTDEICTFLHIESINVEHEIRTNVNQGYFNIWNETKNRFSRKGIIQKYESRVNNLGYSITNLNEKPIKDWLSI